MSPKTDTDATANAARLKEHTNDVLPTPPPLNVDTDSPVANFLSRNNIVADGPGTVADFIAAEDPSLLPADDSRSPESPERAASTTPAK